jgi:hypothetical protein
MSTFANADFESDPNAKSDAGGSDAILYRHASESRHPPLSVQTYARLIYHALVSRHERDLPESLLLWIPQVYVVALDAALHSDGFALGVLLIDHGAAGGIPLARVHVTRCAPASRGDWLTPTA